MLEITVTTSSWFIEEIWYNYVYNSKRLKVAHVMPRFFITICQFQNCPASQRSWNLQSTLKDYLTKYSILSPHQSGFKTGHCSIYVATLVLNDILCIVDNKMHNAPFFIDLSKAFDTVDRLILLNRIY